MLRKKIPCPCSTGEEGYSIETMAEAERKNAVSLQGQQRHGGGGGVGVGVAREMVARVGGKFLRADVKDKNIPIKQALWNSFKNQVKVLDSKGEGR